MLHLSKSWMYINYQQGCINRMAALVTSTAGGLNQKESHLAERPEISSAPSLSLFQTQLQSILNVFDFPLGQSPRSLENDGIDFSQVLIVGSLMAVFFLL